MNNFLAIDYGDRRVGLAVGYADVTMAFPRETIDRKKTEDFIADILAIAKKERTDALVVGMPYHPDHEEEHMHDKSGDVKKFIKILEERTELPIFTQNEAYSSEQAKTLTAHISTKKKIKDKGRIDRVAATVFLQEFIDEKGWA